MSIFKLKMRSRCAFQLRYRDFILINRHTCQHTRGLTFSGFTRLNENIPFTVYKFWKPDSTTCYSVLFLDEIPKRNGYLRL